MSESCTVVINGEVHQVAVGISLASAMLNLGVSGFRRDAVGAPRAPVCGMGVCQECRATVDGVPGVRTCLVIVRDGMRVEAGR